MSFWDRLAALRPFAPRAYVEQSVGRSIAAWPVGQPVWMDRNYPRFADEAYIRNAVAFRCVKMIAGACASIPWILKDAKGNRIDDHVLLDLLAAPAPTVSSQALWEAFYAYLLLAGNSYLEAVGPSDNRPPMELWPHRPDRMQVIAGHRGVPQAHALIVNGAEKQRWTVDQVTGRGAILHVKEFHPLSDWYGLSRVDPAAYGIDRHNAASAHNKALLDNGARPTGALVFKPVTVNGSAISAPDAVIAKAEALMAERHSGPDKAGRGMVFGGDVEWKEMGISPRDMDFSAGKNDAARDICVGFGVPHILIVPGTQSYNNLAMARLELYEDTVLPLAGQLLSAMNAWLTPRFGDGLRLEQDIDGIPALEPRREARRSSASTLFKSGLLTRNEAREMLRYEKIPGPAGDELAVPGMAGEEPGATPDPQPGDVKTD